MVGPLGQRISWRREGRKVLSYAKLFKRRAPSSAAKISEPRQWSAACLGRIPTQPWGEGQGTPQLMRVSGNTPIKSVLSVGAEDKQSGGEFGRTQSSRLFTLGAEEEEVRGTKGREGRLCQFQVGLGSDFGRFQNLVALSTSAVLHNRHHCFFPSLACLGAPSK